jgi:hypothetical protein
MMRGSVWTVLALCVAGAAAAGTVPAELPPADYAGRQYVDSRGCVFQRAGVSGAVVWVPRLGSDNQPVCGMEPSVAAAAPLAETAAAEPAGATAAAAGSAPAAKAAPGKPAKPKAIPPALVETETVSRAETRCLGRIGSAERYWISDGRRVIKCGPPAENAELFVNDLGAPGLSVLGVDGSEKARARARALGRNGYVLAWANGPVADAPAASLAAAPGRFWVQVGAFAETANADRAAHAVQAAGLPAARQPLRGGALSAVLAGPFATQDEAASALALLRTGGYPEAFLRR